jgi:hypothetical protein
MGTVEGCTSDISYGIVYASDLGIQGVQSCRERRTILEAISLK